MQFTFGIVTTGRYPSRVIQIIQSIYDQHIPEDSYEIIIVGGDYIVSNKVRVIPFDENIKPNWITRKKNIITQEAAYENIVYMHDYIVFDPGWYQGWKKYGNDFVAGMNIILNTNGTRYRDWCVLHHIFLWDGVDMGFPIDIQMNGLIPYSETGLSKWMYFSGAYWVAKKSLMTEIPLNESRVWGQGEDVTWSYQVTRKYNFSMNPYSTVKLLTLHDTVFTVMSQEMYENVILPFKRQHNL